MERKTQLVLSADQCEWGELEATTNTVTTTASVHGYNFVWAAPPWSYKLNWFAPPVILLTDFAPHFVTLLSPAVSQSVYPLTLYLSTINANVVHNVYFSSTYTFPFLLHLFVQQRLHSKGSPQRFIIYNTTMFRIGRLSLCRLTHWHWFFKCLLNHSLCHTPSDWDAFPCHCVCSQVLLCNKYFNVVPNKYFKNDYTFTLLNIIDVVGINCILQHPLPPVKTKNQG